MNQSALHVNALRLPPWRARLLLICLLLWFVGLLGRAVYLQGLHSDFLRQKGESRYTRVIDLPATRGMIVDRNNEPLAISTPVESVAASPGDVTMTADQAERLAQLLDMQPAEIRHKLADRRRDFVYLKRQLPPDQAARVVELNIPGIFLHREYRRYYPAGEVMAHVIGYTNIDDKGQEGLELAYNKYLAGTAGSRRVIKDNLGHIVEDVENIRTPQNGELLRLSLDSKIQYLAFRDLRNAVIAHHAKAGSIVVLDVHTGEVLALANLPSYNPNNRERFDPRRTRNRAVTDQYEPGSTLKPFTIAAALDAGIITPDTVIQTAPGTLTIERHTIHDAEVESALTVAQVIQKSSNVGAAKIALRMPPVDMWNMFMKIGLGRPPGSGFPGEAAGMVRPYAKWRPIEQATMAFGNGIAVSLLQLARAYMIFATDGKMRPVTFIKRDTPEKSVQVIPPHTAREVRRMLELVVQPGGTAPQAQIPGYRVAGKTGTAHKVENGGYSPTKYVASFVGFAPASAPRLIIAVSIDQPVGQYYGGLVAAPVFSDVMAGALRLLDVAPDAPMTNVALPKAARTVKEGT